MLCHEAGVVVHLLLHQPRCLGRLAGDGGDDGAPPLVVLFKAKSSHQLTSDSIDPHAILRLLSLNFWNTEHSDVTKNPEKNPDASAFQCDNHAPLFSPDGSDWWRSRRQRRGGSRGARGLGRLLAAGARLLEENGPDRFICCNEKKMSRTSNNGFWTMKEDFGFCGRNEWGL